MKFLPTGLWRIYEADLFMRTFLFVIEKRSWTIYSYHKGKPYLFVIANYRNNLPCSRDSNAIALLSCVGKRTIRYWW